MAGENTKLTGTLLISAISPYNSTDTYPTHYAKYGHGGYRTVHDIIDLDNIPHERREDGMLVYVATEDKIYKYKDGGFAILELGSGNSDDALTEAKAYADGLAVNYDAAGAAETAEQNAKEYADSLAGNYDAAGSAEAAEQNAKDYSDELIKKYPVLEVVNDDGNIDIYNQNNCINFYTNPEKKTLVSHPMRYVNGYKEQGTELNNVAEGNYSTVIGYGCNTVVGSSNSFCGGDVSTASHANCFVYGEGLNTITSNETVIGRFNNFANFEQWGDNKPLFEVGGGSGDSNRITMFMIQKNTGIVFAHSEFKVEGMGDFAEYFEWFDGNPNNEDRMGYMVQLNGEKIEIATTFKNCIGITSGTNSFTADSASLDWHGRFLKDDFGRPIYEKLENGEVRQKLNPDYNPSEEYIPRMYRKEWIPVGLVGKILTRQDGTLNVGDLAGCLNGVATKSTDGNGYRVLKIINNKIALLLVK